MSETRAVEHVATVGEVAKMPGMSWRERAADLNAKGVALGQRYNLLVQSAAATRAELERERAAGAFAYAHPWRWLWNRIVWRGASRRQLGCGCDCYQTGSRVHQAGCPLDGTPDGNPRPRPVSA